MKRIFIAAFLIASFFAKAQNNILLNGNFWKENPSLSLVQDQIAKGNNPSEANGGNHDVVSMAINNGADLEVIKFLINQPGNAVSKTTHDGRLYIHWAASKGNVELVKYLIEQGSDINRTDDKGATPVAFAASNGQKNTDVYELFFNAGIKPTQKYNGGATVLMLAIPQDQDLKLKEYFISKGLNIKDTDDLGRTAFDYAARNGNIEIMNNLLAQGVKPTQNALIFAAQGARFHNNNLETFEYLVNKAKVKPKAVGENGETVLHHLAKKPNQQEIIAYFITKKVDVNAVDKAGDNVLMVAAGAKDLATVQQILARTKNINAANNKGETALYAAVQKSTPEVITFLIEKGANADVVTKDGNLAFALVQAYQKPRPGQNSDEFVQKLNILKNQGVDFTATLADGSSLYHAAVVKNDMELLKMLEGFQIDINAKDDQGLTPIHKAAMMGQNDSILKYLLAHGAKKDVLTDFDETVYDIASENESFKANNVNIEFLK
ncbi:ankyrin repeat domain-containing protein [Flavobacterium agricola]|nr:ankyrin repeat domain-containing protein [Flavobacterium agricola]